MIPYLTPDDFAAAADEAGVSFVGNLLDAIDAYTRDPDVSYCYLHRRWEDGVTTALAHCAECGHVYADPFGMAYLDIEVPTLCELCGHDL